MKRIALFILSLALAAPAFAQEGDSRDIYTNGIFAFNTADHVGWGYNIVTTDAFTPAYCGEYFINVLALKVRPVQGLTLKLGVDCKWDDFGSKKDYFFRADDKTVQAMKVPDVISLIGVEKFSGRFGYFSLALPVMAKVSFDKFDIGGGAELNFNLAGSVRHSYYRGDTNTSVSTTKIGLNTFTYNFMGFVGFDGFDVFAKFYPKASRPLAAGSLNYSCWTIGVAADF